MQTYYVIDYSLYAKYHKHNIYINKYRYIYIIIIMIIYYYYDYYATRIRVWMILRKVYILY